MTNLADVLAAVDGSSVVYLLVGLEYSLDVWRRDWPRLLAGQLRITAAAVRAWRGAAARARLRGQLAGLLGLPRMLANRRAVQAGRTVSDDYIFSLLTEA